ncbi:PAS domain-containing sensor histidine kinase [bacterium]|nr:PAS domain-containing sensor histidine kinase [bacterium]
MNLLNLFNKNGVNPKDILMYLPDAVFIVEEETGNIIWVNNKASLIFGIAREDFPGNNFDDFVPQGMELAYQSSCKDVSVIGGAAINDKEFFIELSANLLDTQYFITIRDVTEMTHILTQAEKTGRLNKDKNLMLTKLSSEFKSPVQSILGFSQALNDGLGGEINDKQRKYVRIINKNATELLYFMDKFFEFASVESQLYQKHLQLFDITELIQSVIRENEVTITTKKLNVTTDFENIASKTVYSDETAMKMILQNILEISIKLTEIGNISIELFNPSLEDVAEMGITPIKSATETSYMLIRICDNGIGLQENDVEGIFEPYTQLDKANKKNLVRSISLGSAKELVRTLNGAIWLQTEVMKGTIFSVIIPVENGAVPQDE